jgi:membrane-associated phospholipid phosphatase
VSPEPSRPNLVPPAVIAVALYVCVAVVAVKVRSRPGPLRADERGRHFITRASVRISLGPFHLGSFERHRALRALVWFGSPLGTGIAVAVLVLLALAWRDRMGATIALAGPLAAEVLTEQVLKPLVDRTGPNGAVYFFPSGHATGVAAVAMVALLLLARRAGRGWALAAAPVLAGWVAAVCVALVQLRYHYFSDVMGGVAVGVATVLTAAVLLAAARPGWRVEPARSWHRP